MNQDGFSSSEPVCIQVVNGKAYEVLQMQGMSEIIPSFNIADVNLKEINESLEENGPFRSNSNNFRSGNDFSENVLSVPMQFLHLAQNASFFSNLPEGTQLQFDVDRKHGKLSAIEVLDKVSDEGDIAFQPNGPVIISYSEDGSKNYLLDPNNLNMLIAENNDPNFVDEDNVNMLSYEEYDDPDLLSGQLMVTKLVKECDESDDVIPDSRTITINNNHSDPVLDKCGSESPSGNKYWTCYKCNKSFNKLLLYKKHNKKHEEDRPYQCLICEESFNFEKNLNLHQSLHNADELKCPECGKVFRRLAGFKAHLSIHQEEEIITCLICGEEFISMFQLHSHKHEKHGSVSPNKSSHPDSKVIKLEPEATDGIKMFFCQKCGTMCDSGSLLKEHMFLHRRMNKLTATKPKQKFIDRTLFDKKCKECGKCFLKPSQLLRHLRIHTGERPYKCSVKGCGRAFNQRGTLHIHMNIHTGKKAYVCELCNKGFIQKSNLRGHLRRVHPVTKGTDPLFSCLECPCVFRKANSLNAHISRAHMSDAYLDIEKTPDEYKNLIKQLQYLDGHNGEVTANKISKVLAGVPMASGSKKFPIEKLSGVDDDILQQALKNSGLEQSKEPQLLPEKGLTAKNIKVEKLQQVKMMTVIEKMHEGAVKRFPVLVRIQDNTKWYMCDFDSCTKEFKKPSDLVRHIRTHTNERPYQCKKCQRAFSIKATLMGHMKTHLVEKEHSCSVCFKKFSTAANLRTHSWVHSGLKPYKCNECGKSFRTISHKKAHILSHTQSAHRMHALKKKSMPLPDIPLQEPILITVQGPVKQTSRFKNVYASYDGHLREDRPHVCQFCQGAFKKSSHLKQHERIHTGEKPFKCELCGKAFGCRSILKSHSKIHTNDRNFTCNVCLKPFVSKGSLTRHYSTHSSNRPYLCPYCHKTFKTNTNCKKHMKIHKQELAMEAIRAAGFNLQGDSEQAIVAANVFNSPSTAEVQEVALRIAENSDHEHPDSVFTSSGNGKENSIITFSSSEASKIMNANFQEFSKNSKANDSGTDSPVHIQATYTQDSLNGNFTLTDFQKKSTILQEDNNIQIITEPTCSISPSQPSIILTSSSDFDEHTSKILINNPNELLCHHESNEETLDQPIGHVYLSPGTIMFENIEHPKKGYDTHPEISATVIQKQNIVEHHGNLGSPEKVESVHRNINYPLHQTHSENVASTKYDQSFKLQRINTFCVAGQQECTDTTKKATSYSSSEELEQAFELNSSSEVTDQRERTIAIKKEQFESSVDEIGTEVFHEPDISSQSKETNEIEISSLPTSHQLLAHDELISTNEHEESLSFEHLPHSESNINISPFKDSKFKENKLTGISRKRAANMKTQGSLLIKLEDFDDESDKKSDFPQNDYSYTCNECGKAYQKYNNLKLHTLKKHNTPVSCKICGENFFSSVEIKKHLQIHKKKTCSICKVQFSTSSELIHHNKKVHHKEPKNIPDVPVSTTDSRKMWHCPVCQSLFTSCEATQEHMITHSQEDISFAIANERKQEMLIAKSSNDERLKLEMTSEAVDQLLQESSVDVETINEGCKLEINQPHSRDITSVNASGNHFFHICNSCGKGFKKPSDLTRHIRTHTGEKPYECTICSKKFAVKSTLDVHKRIHTGRKEFKCNTCKTLYSSKGSLKVHMRLHTGAKPLKCAYCGMKFRTSGHRKAHVAKHFKLKDCRVNKIETVETETINNPDTMYIEDNILSSSVDVNEDINSVMLNPDGNSVMINPDGTVTLQINGLSLSGLEPSSVGLLNLPPLSDSVFDHVQFCSSDSLEMQNSSVVEEVGEDSLSVNPNVVMTRRDRPSDLSSHKNSIDEKGHVEVNLSQEHNIIVLQNNASTTSRELFKAKNLSNIFIEHYFSSPISSDDIIRCGDCEKTFASSKDFEEHMKAHSIVKRPSDVTNIKKNISHKSPNKITLNKTKIWKCPYPNCPLSFQCKNDVQCHMDNLHNINYECSECKEVFLSRSFLQQHLYTDHCASKSFKCANCRQYFHTKEELMHHTSLNSECLLQMQTENCYIGKNIDLKTPSNGSSSGKIRLVDSVTRESLDEDSEPLMIRDIFLSQS